MGGGRRLLLRCELGKASVGSLEVGLKGKAGLEAEVRGGGEWLMEAALEAFCPEP